MACSMVFELEHNILEVCEPSTSIIEILLGPTTTTTTTTTHLGCGNLGVLELNIY